MKIKINEIIFREDLYPRFEPNQAIIHKYSESIEHLPPIKLDQHNILIDGFHRMKGYMLAGLTEIPYEVIEVESEKELKKLAYQYNSNHGIQLSNDEKRKYAIEMIEEMSVAELATLLSVSRQIIENWTKNKREELEKERNRKIIEMYLRAWNTQQSIANELGIGVATVNEIIKKFENAKYGKTEQDFNPLLYNIWKTPNGNETSHFGSFPKIFMDNLIYYHTEPLDIIFDPFAGNGTTIDSCKDLFRRYYCSDRIVKPGREKDIRKYDINDGLPNDLIKPKMAFLDPPYWKQASGKYSNDSEDLSNMTLDNFNDNMIKLLDKLSKRKIDLIAMVIAPTQYPNENHEYIDHIFYFHQKLYTNYKIKMRYIIPYSTEQYNGTQVNVAKDEKICLNLIRDLIIWERI